MDVVSSATSPYEQLKFEIMNEIKNSGVPKVLASPLSLVFAKRARGKRKIWWEKNGSFDPIPSIQKSKIPVLKVFGAMDENVPVEQSLSIIDELLFSHPNIPLTVKTFKDSGHALFNAETDWIRNDYLDYIIEWVSKQKTTPK